MNLVDPTGHSPNWAQVGRGLVKVADGMFDFMGGGGLATGAVASSPSVIGAIALGAVAAFMMTDGAFTVTDGIGDIIVAFIDGGDQVPVLNPYDHLANSSGPEGQGILLGARMGCALMDAAVLSDLVDSETMLPLARQAVNVYADCGALAYCGTDLQDPEDYDALDYPVQ